MCVCVVSVCSVCVCLCEVWMRVGVFIGLCVCFKVMDIKFSLVRVKVFIKQQT